MAEGAIKDITVIVDNNGDRRPAKLAAELARVTGAHLAECVLGQSDGEARVVGHRLNPRIRPDRRPVRRMSATLAELGAPWQAPQSHPGQRGQV